MKAVVIAFVAGVVVAVGIAIAVLMRLSRSATFSPPSGRSWESRDAIRARRPSRKGWQSTRRAGPAQPNYDPPDAPESKVVVPGVDAVGGGAAMPGGGNAPSDTAASDHAEAPGGAEVWEGIQHEQGEEDAGKQSQGRALYAEIDAPEAVVQGRVFSAKIGLAAAPSPHTTPSPLYAPLDAGPAYTLTIQVALAGLHLRDEHDAIHRLEVSPEVPFPSKSIEVEADALTVGDSREATIVLVYSVGGQIIGIAQRDVVVIAHEAVETASAPQPHESLQLQPPVGEGVADLTVAIVRKRGEPGVLTWTLTSPHVGIVNGAGVSETDIGTDPQSFADTLIEGVELHEGRPDLFEHIRGQGLTVANHIPAAFWAALEASRSMVDGTPTVLLLSQEPYVPWEIAVTEGHLSAPFVSEAGPFLGAQVRMGRWFAEENPRNPPRPTPQPSASLTIDVLAVVSGHYLTGRWSDLEGAMEETRLLVQQYEAVTVDATLADVRACLLGHPAAQLVHFATHGKYEGSGARQGIVMVDDSYLDPTTVAGYDLPAPLIVFLNACQVGTGSVVLGDYSGLAAAFLRAGASAVVAPLWSVDDNLAREVAIEFYDALFDGVSPAEILRRDRASFAADPVPDKATRLAYQYFGHPDLRVTRRHPIGVGP